jgi:hypothetical protein
VKDQLKNAFKFVAKTKEEKVLSYKYRQAERDAEVERAAQRELEAEIGQYS